MEYSFTQYLSSLPRTPVVKAVQSLYESVDLDDNLAAKFAQTTFDIYKATTWIVNKIQDFGEAFIVYMNMKLDSPNDNYTATIPFKFADMGLSDDFVKLLPPTLYLSFRRPPKNSSFTDLAYSDTSGLLADFIEDGSAKYASTGIYIYPGMDTLDTIIKAIRWLLPHELRHVVDTCDNATIQLMSNCLQHNNESRLNGKFSTYWDDPGEYNARLSEVLGYALYSLTDERIRKKFHSAKELVDKLVNTDLYKQAVGDVDDNAKAVFRKNIELILSKLMNKLI